MAGGCLGLKDCLYPNPNNCNTFIKCLATSDKGTAVVIPCPIGLQWNDNKKQCEYPEESTCPT